MATSHLASSLIYGDLCIYCSGVEEVGQAQYSGRNPVLGQVWSMLLNWMDD